MTRQWHNAINDTGRGLGTLLCHTAGRELHPAPKVRLLYCAYYNRLIGTVIWQSSGIGLTRRQHEVKTSAILITVALRPDMPAVRFDDVFADRQAQSGAITD